MPENESTIKKPVAGADFFGSPHFLEQVCLETGAEVCANAKKQPAAVSKIKAAVIKIFLLILLFFDADCLKTQSLNLYFAPQTIIRR